ncbi:hypothetical protein AALB53_24170, partial [Lachnospiraceae bacterium 47-T17]
MARDRNFQRKQKDARMPARDSHGEDRMAARQGEPDFDLRRARDAPSSGTSRNHRQAAPVQTETYGSDILLFGKLSAPTFFTLNAPVFQMVWIN